MAKSAIFEVFLLHLLPLSCNIYTVIDNRVILARNNVFLRYEGYIQDSLFNEAGAVVKDRWLNSFVGRGFDGEVAPDAIHG